jgi:hypothetical protein
MNFWLSVLPSSRTCSVGTYRITDGELVEIIGIQTMSGRGIYQGPRGQADVAQMLQSEAGMVWEKRRGLRGYCEYPLCFQRVSV